MMATLATLLSVLRSVFRARRDLVLEIAALRQQLAVYQRQSTQPRVQRRDRMFWIWLARNWAGWKSALVFVKPETVLRWHRDGYRRYWTWRSKAKSGRPPIPRKHIEFIRRISSDHPDWGEDRIALELKLKLGVEHSTSTSRRYMVPAPSSGSNWRQFVSSHASEIWAVDFTTEVLWNFSARYVFVVIALDSRRIVHTAVTAAPTLAWVKQQLREASAWGQTPRFLLHDNDGIFGQLGSQGPRPRYRSALDRWLHQVLGVKGIPTPYGAPNANAHVERFVGTLRRECLEHFIFTSEAHLRRVVIDFGRYYNESRPHQGIDNIPHVLAGRIAARSPPDPEDARLIARPVLGGLAHDYDLAA